VTLQLWVNVKTAESLLFNAVQNDVMSVSHSINQSINQGLPM